MTWTVSYEMGTIAIPPVGGFGHFLLTSIVGGGTIDHKIFKQAEGVNIAVSDNDQTSLSYTTIINVNPNATFDIRCFHYHPNDALFRASALTFVAHELIHPAP